MNLRPPRYRRRPVLPAFEPSFFFMQVQQPCSRSYAAAADPGCREPTDRRGRVAAVAMPQTRARASYLL